jgi:hypothetical protein
MCREVQQDLWLQYQPSSFHVVEVTQGVPTFDLLPLMLPLLLLRICLVTGLCCFLGPPPPVLPLACC